MSLAKNKLNDEYGGIYDVSAINNEGLANGITKNENYTSTWSDSGMHTNVWKKIIDRTIANGKPLSESELKSYIGGNDYNVIKKQYDTFLNDNENQFGFNSVSTEKVSSRSEVNSQDFYRRLGDYANEMKSNLMLDPNDDNALAYKENMYSALEENQASVDASLAASEMDSYAMLGQQQLQLENTIAEQRMRALKSGTTSAQLASQQLANMFAAQSGAAQVATNIAQTRRENANTYAQSRYGIIQDMYNTIGNNRTTYATNLAQLGAVAGSYASTVDQPQASWDSYGTVPYNVKKLANGN